MIKKINIYNPVPQILQTKTIIIKVLHKQAMPPTGTLYFKTLVGLCA